MEIKELFCNTCNELVSATAVVQPHPHKIKDEIIYLTEANYFCPICGEKFMLFKDAEENEKKAYQIYRQRKGLLSPDEIKHIRQKYGMSQTAFAKVLGLGEKTITRYENGYLPDLAPNNLIRLVDNVDSFLILWNRVKHEFTDAEQRKIEINLFSTKESKQTSNYRTYLSHSHNVTALSLNNFDFAYSWFNLKYELNYKNRFFPDNNLLSDLLPYFRHVTVNLSATKNVTFFRAREKEITNSNNSKGVDHYLLNLLMSLQSKKETTSDIIQKLKDEYPESKQIEDMENGFYGYDASNSGAPPIPKSVVDGRANPNLISYLYLTEDPGTAIAEISPIPSAWISIGIFKLNQSLTLVDLSGESNDGCSGEYMQLSRLIAQSFSLIAKNASDYYITQYVSEYIKKQGYDGIIYKSAKCVGKNNLVLFDEEKVEAVGSELYEVDSAETTYHKVFPLE